MSGAPQERARGGLDRPCPGHRTGEKGDGPDPGDFVITVLAGTLADLRDRLADDGLEDAANLVADLVELAEDYVGRAGSGR